MFRSKEKTKNNPSSSTIKTTSSTVVVTSGNSVTTTTIMTTEKYNTWSSSKAQSSTVRQESTSIPKISSPMKPLSSSVFDAQPFQKPTYSSLSKQLSYPNPSSISSRPVQRPGLYQAPSISVSSMPTSGNNINMNYKSPYRPTERRNSEYLQPLRPKINQSSSLTSLSEPKKLNMKVTKSIKFLDDVGKVPTYKTRSKYRGKVLIINNIKFKDPKSNRQGAEVDQENLTMLFKGLGKWKAIFETNLTANGMKNAINTFVQNKSTEKYDISMLIIMSHGTGQETSDSTQILGTDMQLVSISWIVEQFKTFMVGKPKIFMFQCCRGEKKDVSTISTDSQRQFSDMLLAYATVPGFVSHRDTVKGTWYIQFFCETVMEHAHDTDVESILKIVDEKLSRMQSLSFQSRQTSNYESRGFKRCYLHPGLWN